MGRCPCFGSWKRRRKLDRNETEKSKLSAIVPPNGPSLTPLFARMSSTRPPLRLCSLNFVSVDEIWNLTDDDSVSYELTLFAVKFRSKISVTQVRRISL